MSFLAVMWTVLPAPGAPPHQISAEEANAILARKTAEREASLYADAHASYLTRNEAHKVQAVYAAHEARETAELASYERFKFDERLALAEASAGRAVTVINNYLGGKPGEEVAPSGLGSAAPGTLRRPTTFRPAGHEPGAGVSSYFGAGSGAAERLQHAPDRFLSREARENGADQAAADSLSRESSAREYDAAHPPAGYLSSPDHGHLLDVRGYPSGTRVRDPYDGRVLTVP